jgi:molybdopterin-guanine dinucleotide biosynthesis protein A
MIAGLILAGGRATRMGGGDKALIALAGRTLLDRTIERTRPQVSRLLLSANGDPNRFKEYGLPVLPDPIGDHWGPLAGILAGLEHLATHWPTIAWMASFPTDCPFLPVDLVGRLNEARENETADLALAESGGRTQPVFALWPVALAAPLRDALRQGVRGVDQFARHYRTATVSWPDEVFFNVNSPDDLTQAAKRLAGGDAGATIGE